MHEADHQHVDRQPGRIEQRVDPVPLRNARSWAISRSTSVLARPATPAASRRTLASAAGDRRRSSARPDQPRARARTTSMQYPSASASKRQRAQHHQRLHAAAGKDAVEHLHHVDRRHQQREIQQQARGAGEQHEGPQLRNEQPAHRCSFLFANGCGLRCRCRVMHRPRSGASQRIECRKKSGKPENRVGFPRGCGPLRRAPSDPSASGLK